MKARLDRLQIEGPASFEEAIEIHSRAAQAASCALTATTTDEIAQSVEVFNALAKWLPACRELAILEAARAEKTATPYMIVFNKDENGTNITRMVSRAGSVGSE